ncbi:hypothetical protein [Paraburkholderia sp.]|uniref:hypothetical protein n=1 Tax=Paraburkholderia sp. TaxID=1926495 RepID=UPI002F41A7D0
MAAFSCRVKIFALERLGRLHHYAASTGTTGNGKLLACAVFFYIGSSVWLTGIHLKLKYEGALMNTILAALGLSMVLGACATDSTPPVSTQTSTELLLSSAGVYQGTLSTGVPITLVTLYNGTAYLFYQKPTAGVIVVTNGRQAADGQFKGATATDYSLYPGAKASAVQLQIDFSHSPDVNGKVAAGDGGAVQSTFAASPEQMLGQGPALATITGAYKGRMNSLHRGMNAEIVITADGLLAGMTSGGCEFRGNVSPNSGVDAYNVSVTYSATPCAASNATVSGSAVLNDGHLLIALPEPARHDIAVFDGAK